MSLRSSLDQNLQLKIVELQNNQFSFRKIADQLQVAKSTCYNIYKLYKETGSTKSMPRTGRTRKTNARFDNYIKRQRHLRIDTKNS